jgi:L-fuculose-phosphate aldolase
MHSVQPVRSIFALRREIVEIGLRLYDRGLIVAAEGNISVRLADNRILVTPAGLCKGRMAAEDLVVVDTAGTKLQGERSPSSELPMHLTAFAIRPDIGACVHAHPPYATAFAVSGIALADCILPEVVAILGSVPLTEYATPSTQEVGDSIAKYLERFDAFLLKNHGVLTIGSDLEEAYRKMEIVERFAEIVSIARGLGAVDELDCRQVDDIMALSKTLHSRFTGDETPVCGSCRVGTNKQ